MPRISFPSHCAHRGEEVSSQQCLECFLSRPRLRQTFGLRFQCVQANLVSVDRIIPEKPSEEVCYD